MNKELKVKVLGAAVLALMISACATHKSATETPPPPEAGTGQNTPAPAAGSGAPESAQASSANGNGGALQASQLPSDSSGANAGAGGSASAANANAAGKAGSGPETAATGTSVSTFYFDYDSSTLHPDETASLQAHAAWLAKTPGAHLRVEGNCDERGTREYNMALGERRAKAVAAFLTSNGAADSQLEIISYGKEKPAVDGHDEAAWSKNRRVELHYTAGQP